MCKSKAKVDQLLLVLNDSQVVVDEPVETTEVKEVKTALKDLKEQVDRLANAKANLPLLGEIHAKASESFAKINLNRSGSKETKEQLKSILKEVNPAVDAGPMLVNLALATKEIKNLDELFGAKIDWLKEKLQDPNSKNPSVRELEATRDTLGKRRDESKSVKLDAAHLKDTKDLKKREEHIQKVRIEYRAAHGRFMAKVDAAWDNSIEPENVAAEAEGHLNGAKSALSKMRPGEAYENLDARFKHCQKEFSVCTDPNMPRPEKITKLAAAAKEAEKIKALAQRDRNGVSKAQALYGKLADARNLAAQDPASGEAKMSSALGQAKFEEMLVKAFEGTAVSGTDISNLSPGDVVAVHNYTSGDYKKMNSHLLAVASGKVNANDHDEYKDKCDVTVAALENLPVYEGGMTMRGEWPWPGDAHKNEYFLGNTFKTKIFWSTGISKCFEEMSIQITVFGKSGRHVTMSEKPEETEVLFPPNTNFKVTAYREVADKKGNEKIYMTVEEV